MSIEDDEYWVNPEPLKRFESPLQLMLAAYPDGQLNPNFEKLLAKMRATHFVLGDPHDDNAPAAIVLDMPPGYGLPYHSHDCDVFMLVIRGSLHVPERVLRAGDCQTARAHEFYGPEVAGPEGCTRVEFFSALHGATTAQYLDLEGKVVIQGQDGFGGDAVPRRIRGMDVMESLRREANNQKGLNKR